MAWHDEVENARMKKSKLPNMTVVMMNPFQQAPVQQSEQARFTGYTGAGANGKVEPEKATMMENTPEGQHVFHEGELVVPTLGGRQVLPASTVRGMMTGNFKATTEEEQMQIARDARARNVKGFATGGYIPDSANVPDFVRDAAANLTPNTNTSAYTTPNNSDLYTNPSVPDFVKDATKASSDAANQYNLTNNNANLQVSAGMPTLAPNLTANASGTAASAAAARGRRSQTAASSTNPTLPSQYKGEAFKLNNPQISFDTGVPAIENGKITSPNGANVYDSQKYQDDPKYKEMVDQALKQISDYSQGNSAADRLIEQQSMSRLGAAQAAEKAANQQAVAQQGLSEPLALAQAQLFERDQQSERGKLMSELATDRAKRAYDATNQLFSSSLQSAEWDHTVKQALDDKQYNRVTAAANALLQAPGKENKEKAKALYESMGIPLDVTQLIRDDNAATFGAVMDEMSSAIDKKLTWDTIPDSVKENWMLSTGMTAQQAEEAYGKQATNSVDDGLELIKQSKAYQNVIAQYPELKGTLDHMLDMSALGMGIEIKTDETGKHYVVDTLTGEVNDGTGWVDKKIQNSGKTAENGSTYSLNEDGTTTITPPTKGYGSNSGEKFIAPDGNVYINMGADNAPKSTTIDFESLDAPDFDPFGNDALMVLKLGSKNNAYYPTVITKLTDAIRNHKMTNTQMVDLAKTGVFASNPELLKSLRSDVTYDESNPPTIGVKKRPGAGNDYYMINGFGNGNEVIEIYGKKYYVSPRENINAAGTDHSIYTITNLSDPTDTFKWDSRDYGGKKRNIAKVWTTLSKVTTPWFIAEDHALPWTKKSHEIATEGQNKLQDLFASKE